MPPRHTRELIAATALAIADAEGIEAVTMRRIATELDAGTMTLYHYVKSKNDLMALMQDAIMAEQLMPAEQLPGDWRAALTAIAYRTRAMFQRHPWAVAGLQAGGGGDAGGPHALRHFEQSLAAVATTGLPAADRLDLIAMIDDYVAGFVLKSEQEPGLESVPPEAAPAVTDYFDRHLATGEYPHIEALLGEGDRWTALKRAFAGYSPDERFARGLQRLLDGVERYIATAAEQPATGGRSRRPPRRPK
ncbi:TetR/AcrR family transcriptional regulator C-terminal domain-containing protein [Rhizocola hellebori]|uniref:TetR/AcrR family transcriptional regulator C-terminal domain-containing protein n=1 Tax=Rhizocola hellebori TaxID=1392758 RepID=UPI00194521EA|nr:TetR/AcrR family transcriptional regulator C-terminal domain-containing protein [Rhizocola hellebori]